ncbi:Dehydrodolichyl diphosphate syntase complex subunit NUS1 [Folsomia candida]|uniref:ditrans,polycis-polyprenyl diphosphate synthase [(2E,6E)-farnesyldiphosphate specific] n=1 Tax=Folsomia candida TaxID=158441 RepID=A0A226F2C2_FOLCA|nr:Dehydrodolichyl diphosphate syntase complex subunit NUS1 [Folsomia candida]
MSSYLELFLGPIKVLAWLILHFIWKIKKFEFQTLFRKSWEPSIYTEIKTLAQISKEDFRKLPQHLALVFHNFEEEQLLKAIILKNVARIITWAWMMDIHIISVYDEKGIIKTNASRMHKFITTLLEEVQAAQSAKNLKIKDLPSLKFCNFTFNNKFEGNYTLKIVLLGEDDGKQGIVSVTKDLFQKGLNYRPTNGLSEAFNNKALDFVTWETAINKNVGLDWCDTEPELMMVFGNVNSTLGFLPWHIRLTEIQYENFLAPYFVRVNLREFFGIIAKV